MAQAALPVLRAQGRGRSIITIGSMAGISPRLGLVWYNATKGAVNTITKAMVLRLAKENIRIAGDERSDRRGLTRSSWVGRTRRRCAPVSFPPSGQVPRACPADIANACVFLAEDASSLITGVLLPLDGGRTA